MGVSPPKIETQIERKQRIIGTSFERYHNEKMNATTLHKEAFRAREEYANGVMLHIHGLKKSVRLSGREEPDTQKVKQKSLDMLERLIPQRVAIPKEKMSVVVEMPQITN